MRALIAILFLSLFVYIQTFNGMIWLTYELNKTAIIQEFCENIDKPELKCEGTCHMKKMMLTEDAEEENSPATELPEIQLFTNDFGLELVYNEKEIEINSIYTNTYSFKFLNDWDIPPKA